MADLDLAGLQAAFDREVEELDRKVKDVIDGSSQRIRANWRRKVAKRRHAPTHIPHILNSITHEVDQKGPLTTAEVGYERSREMPGMQGAFGHFLEFGYLPHNTQPGFEGLRSLHEEVPRLFAEMAKAAEIDL